MPPALQYQGITKVYKSAWRARQIRALQDFSLAVNHGEIFGFLGPNGAGKSTAIHLALGFTRATAGHGEMLGRPFGDAGTRRRIGFLPENIAIYNRTAESAVRFYAGLNGIHGNRLDAAARDALEMVNLLGESTRKVGQFSRGMLQRLGLAQALVNDPELLILDEPTSALDPAGRVAVRELLLHERNRGKTIFLSSHLLSEVELVCDRVAMLRQGRLVHVGSLSDLLQTADQVEITARGVSASLFPGATGDGNSLVRFTRARSQQRQEVERIWNAGGELVSLNPVRRSLEEVFLELTGPDSPDVGARN